jgi:hypothetical protein
MPGSWERQEADARPVGLQRVGFGRLSDEIISYIR